MSLRNCLYAAAVMILTMACPAAMAGVSVNILDANTAQADVSLTDASSHTYTATVTITFDNAVNLSAGSLNLTAQLVDPLNPPTLPIGVTVDAAFPVIISVEPPVPLFLNGFESNQTGNGQLSFFNTYELDIHTTDLACSSSASKYRLYKAPHGSNLFADVTYNIYSGSVRARGRGGAFSQFLVAKDQQVLLTVALDKVAALSTRLLASGITGALLTSLTSLVANVLLDVLTLNIGGAITSLDNFIVSVVAGAGTTIANEWTAGGTLTNDAGELLSLADTLRFTLTLLQGSSTCLAPPP